MKRRPRRIEQKVAEHISEYLNGLGLGSVSRIPVLGREGPDIDILPGLGMAIDVKSRKSIPKSYQLSHLELRRWEVPQYHYHRQIGARLEDFNLLFDAENFDTHLDAKMSVTIHSWMIHMSLWCTGKIVLGEKRIIPALVLHWPRAPIKHSTFVIFETDRSELYDRWKRINNL